MLFSIAPLLRVDLLIMLGDLDLRYDDQAISFSEAVAGFDWVLAFYSVASTSALTKVSFSTSQSVMID